MELTRSCRLGGAHRLGRHDDVTERSRRARAVCHDPDLAAARQGGPYEADGVYLEFANPAAVADVFEDCVTPHAAAATSSALSEGGEASNIISVYCTRCSRLFIHGLPSTALEAPYQ